jgi:CRP-like cAMP-binding protein
MRLRKNAKVELIRAVPLFSHCSNAQLGALAAEADELDFPEGRILTQEGDRGREFMVIVDGWARVTRNGRKVNELGRGDFFGEIALISGAPRTATVTTTAPTRVLVLTDRAFKRVTRDMPAINASLVKALSERLQADVV